MSTVRDTWEAARRREAKLLRQSANSPPKLTPEQQAANRRKNAIAKSVETARRKDRGDDHPATSDHEYTDREWEFMQAMRAYQEVTGRKFPSWSEALSVIDGLGYRKGEAL